MSLPTLRDYQVPAVQQGLYFFKSSRIEKPRLIVAPTAAGKSIIIAAIAHGLDGRVLVIQPSAELLIQNFNKYILYDQNVSAYSASVNQKRLAKVTFATIGSIVSCPEIFAEFQYMIMDEAHLYPPGDESMFGKFIAGNPQLKILGLTATPFRPKRSQTGTQLSMMHNSHIFKGYQHIIQIQEISEKYWAKVDYIFEVGKENVLQVNTTRAEFTEKSLILYQQSVEKQINDIIAKFIDTPMLIFVTSVADAQRLARKYPGSGFVCGKTKKAERKKLIDDFRSGRITRVFNVGVLGVGFDYPGLIAIIDAVPTLSLAKHYQKFGRLTRPHPLGLHVRKFYFDLAGNTRRFGYMEDLEIRKVGTTYHVFSKHRKLTSEYVDQMDMNDTGETKKKKFENVLFMFGKHKGKRITECPDFYLSWVMDNVDNKKLKENIKIYFENKSGEVQMT